MLEEPGIRGTRAVPPASGPAPLVSIVIASYNYGRFLGEAIASALAQRDAAVEVVVVDDGSTDDSAAVAGRFPVRLIRQVNAGVCLARNRGAAAAHGELLVFLDADDLLEPDYVARCREALAVSGPTVAYAYTQMRLFGEEEGIFASRPFDARAMLRERFVHGAALLRRASFDEVGGFDPAWRNGLEDYELWIRLLDRGYTGTFVSEPLLRYRRHGPSRNDLAPETIRSLLWRLKVSYPRLFWRDILRHPARAARALRARVRTLDRGHIG